MPKKTAGADRRRRHPRARRHRTRVGARDIPEFLRPSMAGPRGTGGQSRLVIIRQLQLVTVTGDNFAPVHSALGPNTGQTRTLRHYAPRHVACLIGDD